MGLLAAGSLTWYGCCNGLWVKVSVKNQMENEITLKRPIQMKFLKHFFSNDWFDENVFVPFSTRYFSFSSKFSVSIDWIWEILWFRSFLDKCLENWMRLGKAQEYFHFSLKIVIVVLLILLSIMWKDKVIDGGSWIFLLVVCYLSIENLKWNGKRNLIYSI